MTTRDRRVIRALAKAGNMKIRDVLHEHQFKTELFTLAFNCPITMDEFIEGQGYRMKLSQETINSIKQL